MAERDSQKEERNWTARKRKRQQNRKHLMQRKKKRNAARKTEDDRRKRTKRKNEKKKKGIEETGNKKEYDYIRRRDYRGNDWGGNRHKTERSPLIHRFGPPETR